MQYDDQNKFFYNNIEIFVKLIIILLYTKTAVKTFTVIKR